MVLNLQIKQGAAVHLASPHWTSLHWKWSLGLKSCWEFDCRASSTAHSGESLNYSEQGMNNSRSSFTAILEAFPSGHISNREWRINSLNILVPKTKVWLPSILYSGRYGLPTQLLSQHNSVILGHPLNKSRTPAVCWALCWCWDYGTELDKQSPAFKGLTVWRGRSQTLNKYNYPIYYLVI